MKVRKEIIYIYGCEVCGAEYGSNDKLAARCEKLPVEKQIFKEGDEVSGRESVGVILDVDLIPPLGDGAGLYDSISRGKHFYVYTVQWPNGFVSTYLKRDFGFLNKNKKRRF